MTATAAAAAPGAIPRGEIEDMIGPLGAPGSLIRSPGQLASHYAPRAALRLNAGEIESGEVLLGFGDAPGAKLNLSPRGDLREAAANLFAMLRELDKTATHIAVLAHSLHRHRRGHQRPPASGGRAAMTIPQAVLGRLKGAAGPKGFSEDPAEIAPHLEEWRSKYKGAIAAAAQARQHGRSLRHPAHLS